MTQGSVQAMRDVAEPRVEDAAGSLVDSGLHGLLL